MNQFDYLIPPHIIEKMALDCVDFELKLICAPARNIWPHVKVSINNDIIFDGIVEQQGTIKYSNKHEPGTVVRLHIEYLDKTDEHTVVDDQKQIVENQWVKIESLLANDVDLVSTNLIYNFGCYFLKLSDTKKQFFKQQGYETETSHSLQMFENGSWILDLKVPILPELIKLKAFYEKHENWPDDKFMTSMYNSIQAIEKLINSNRKH